MLLYLGIDKAYIASADKLSKAVTLAGETMFIGRGMPGGTNVRQVYCADRCVLFCIISNVPCKTISVNSLFVHLVSCDSMQSWSISCAYQNVILICKELLFMTYFSLCYSIKFYDCIFYYDV